MSVLPEFCHLWDRCALRFLRTRGGPGPRQALAHRERAGWGRPQREALRLSENGEWWPPQGRPGPREGSPLLPSDGGPSPRSWPATPEGT